MGLCIFAESAGAPGKPAKIARFRNIPSTAVQHDETPRTGWAFLPAAAPARAARAGATQAFPPLGLPDPCNVPRTAPHQADDATARVMLVAVSLAWGLSWPALKIALNDIPPFSMRVGTSGLATVTLFALALLRRRNMRIHSSVVAVHLVVAGCLNIACFTLFSAFAQLATATSRVAVLAYTMPIWAALFAYPVLGERLNLTRRMSLLLCAIGLTVLIYPLLGSSDVIGLVFAIATAVSWAAGTVYLKWARIDADPMAISAWQLVVALVVTFAGSLIFEGSLHLWPVPARARFGRWRFPGLSVPPSPICFGSRSSAGYRPRPHRSAC